MMPPGGMSGIQYIQYEGSRLKVGRTVSVKSKSCAPDCTVYFFPEQEKLKGVSKMLLWHVVSRCLCLFVCCSLKCSIIVVNDINKCYISLSRPFVFVLKWMLCSVCQTDLSQLGENRWKPVEKAFSNTLWVVFWTLFRYLMVMMCRKRDIWRNSLACSKVEGSLGVLCRGWPRWTLKPNSETTSASVHHGYFQPVKSLLFSPSVTTVILLTLVILRCIIVILLWLDWTPPPCRTQSHRVEDKL